MPLAHDSTRWSTTTLHPATRGMDPKMALAVSRLLQASGGKIWIVSGFRSYDQQTALYQKYLNGTGNLAAKPGTSLHESGFAVDFGGDKKWLAENAERYGLWNSVPSENWHYSLIGSEGKKVTETHNQGGEGAGGHVGGSGQPDPGPARLASNATEAEIQKFITEHYGPLAVALLKEPELRKALITAAQQGLVDTRFEELISKTKWWQSRSASMRQWDMLQMQDPREIKDRLEKRKAALAPIWEQYGLDGDINKMALDMERLGLNEHQLNAAVADQMLKESDKTGLDQGTEGATSADRLMTIARQEYLTPVDRQTAERWAIKAVRTGVDIEESWRAYLAGISSQRFGIDPLSGVAPADVMSPIKMSVAENLEIAPETVDLLDPRFAELLQVRTEDGTYRPMTSAEATRWARSQEQFKGTKKAEEASSGLAEALAKTFGKVG
jgi:hypothetical protein